MATVAQRTSLSVPPKSGLGQNPGSSIIHGVSLRRNAQQANLSRAGILIWVLKAPLIHQRPAFPHGARVRPTARPGCSATSARVDRKSLLRRVDRGRERMLIVVWCFSVLLFWFRICFFRAFSRHVEYTVTTYSYFALFITRLVYNRSWRHKRYILRKYFAHHWTMYALSGTRLLWNWRGKIEYKTVFFLSEIKRVMHIERL